MRSNTFACFLLIGMKYLHFDVSDHRVVIHGDLKSKNGIRHYMNMEVLMSMKVEVLLCIIPVVRFSKFLNCSAYCF